MRKEDMLTEDYCGAKALRDYYEGEMGKIGSLVKPSIVLMGANWGIMAGTYLIYALICLIPFLEYTATKIFPIAYGLVNCFIAYRVYKCIIKPMGGISVLFGMIFGIANNGLLRNGMMLFSLALAPVFELPFLLLHFVISLFLLISIPVYTILIPPLYLLLLAWQYKKLIRICDKEMKYYVKTNDPSVQEYMENEDYYTQSNSYEEPLDTSYPTVTDVVNKFSGVAKSASSTIADVAGKISSNTHQTSTQTQTAVPQKLFCGKCGAKRGEGKFCGKCGAKLV